MILSRTLNTSESSGSKRDLTPRLTAARMNGWLDGTIGNWLRLNGLFLLESRTINL